MYLFLMLETESWLKSSKTIYDLKYDVAYWVLWGIERQLELIDENAKTSNFNVQDVKNKNIQLMNW